MWHAWTPDVEFYRSLYRADQQLAEEVRVEGCPCGGRLDRSDYPRKPRGIPVEVDHLYSRRISFCCCLEGCRRRVTPPSVRFAGRRVYVGAIVLWACMTVAEPAGVPARTIRRWNEYWQLDLPASSWWRAHRGVLTPELKETELPGSLVRAFVGTSRAEQLRQALHWLKPLSTTSWKPRNFRGGKKPQTLAAAPLGPSS